MHNKPTCETCDFFESKEVRDSRRFTDFIIISVCHLSPPMNNSYDEVTEDDWCSNHTLNGVESYYKHRRNL